MLFRAIWRAYLALPIWSRNGSALSGGTAWGWPVFLSLWPTRYFEQTVNLGRGGAGKYLQRLCNALNYNKSKGERLFTDLVEDGAVGNKTLDALSAILARRSGEADVVHALNCMQGAHYVGLAAKNFQHRQFMDGWMKRTY